jgi:hypothetical protein
MDSGVLGQKDLTPFRAAITPAPPPELSSAQYHEFSCSRAEAVWIVGEMQRLHDEMDFKYEDMAVLTRANKSFLFPQSYGVLQHLKEELLTQGIPHRVHRGSTYAAHTHRFHMSTDLWVALQPCQSAVIAHMGSCAG